jgi:hypothetical protein
MEIRIWKKPANPSISHNFIGGTLGDDPAGIDNIGPIDANEGLSNIMIGDQDSYTPGSQQPQLIADFPNRNRINPGKRFIKEDKGRARRERPRYFASPTLTARNLRCRHIADAIESKSLQQYILEMITTCRGKFLGFQHKQDVLLDR